MFFFIYNSLNYYFHCLLVQLTSLFVLIHSADFNLDVFRIFVELHDFKGRSLVDALR